MPSKNPAENIDAIAEFTAGMDWAAFSADRKTVYAVVRALEIAGLRSLAAIELDRLPRSSPD